MPVGGLVLGEPLVDHLGDLGVLADEDEDRRPRIVGFPLPILAQLLPQSAQHRDGRVCAYLRIASGLGLPFLPPRSAAVSFAAMIHCQMLK